ncbi:MAG TPA: HD domain-containing protein, partial [Candidatus Paceibacterota bacterium]|nr:HD domain-containing protein [Candidatus Paceibacterota bacterium]
MKTHFEIPGEVKNVMEQLEERGYEAYLIGGCVRDLFLEKEPKDWDVTTNATPEEIQGISPDSFYENDFGTVGVKTESEDERLKVIEVTPYRVEGEYSNNRHPDKVEFSKDIKDDLKRRDFTINAIAFRETNKGESEIVDLFEGIKDLQKGIIRTVGNPKDRFNEDGLRILRAVRLATQLRFQIEEETEKAVFESRGLLKNISAERIRDEISKIIATDEPMRGFELLKKLGLLPYTIPELEEGINCGQNQAHSFDVFEHLLRSLQHAADKKYPFEIRLAALLHDIGKPATKRIPADKKEPTFYGHEVVGARMTKKILERLKFSRETIEKVTKLVRWHMFFSDTETITLSAVRRMIANVGQDSIWDLMNVRICDRIGTGRPKESPYRLRKYHSMIEEALRDPVSVSQLKIDGNDLMNEGEVTPGPAMGHILHALLEEVLDDPKKNNKEYLLNRVK